MASLAKDPYAILSVPTGASDAEIKAAYKRLAVLHHPDLGGEQSVMAEVNWAYALLSDPEQRRHYDQFGYDLRENGPKSLVEVKVIEMWQAVVSARGFDTRVDYLAECRVRFDHLVAHKHAELEQLDYQLARFKSLQGRVISKTGELRTIFQLWLNRNIHATEQAMRNAQSEIDLLNRCYEYTEDFEFKAEPELITTAGANYHYIKTA